MMNDEELKSYFEVVNRNDSLESIITNIKNIFTGIVKIHYFEDSASLVDIASSTKAIIPSIPDMLYLNKADHWIFQIFKDHRDKKALAWKFKIGEPEVINNTRRQIQLINQINELKQIEYFATLTAAWLFDQIDDALYFKLANVLTRCISEELLYLERNITDEEVESNIYVDSFEHVGFTKMVSISSNGTNMYKYTDLAKNFKKYAVDFIPDYDAWLGINETLKLENIKPENRKSEAGAPVVRF